MTEGRRNLLIDVRLGFPGQSRGAVVAEPGIPRKKKEAMLNACKGTRK